MVKRAEKNPARIGLRLPPHLQEYLASKARIGTSITGVVLELLQLGKDLEEVLGPDIYEVERQAKVEGVGTGTMLGRMAKTALEKGKRK